MPDDRFKNVLAELQAMHDRKAADYGHGEDEYANCRASAAFGLPAWVGVAIRMGDKLTRIQAFARNGKLKNESLKDSFIDIAVYSIISLILLEEAARAKENQQGGCS